MATYYGTLGTTSDWQWAHRVPPRRRPTKTPEARPTRAESDHLGGASGGAITGSAVTIDTPAATITYILLASAVSGNNMIDNVSITSVVSAGPGPDRRNTDLYANLTQPATVVGWNASIENCPNPTRTGSSPYLRQALHAMEAPRRSGWRQGSHAARKSVGRPAMPWMRAPSAGTGSAQCRGYGRISCGKNNSRPATPSFTNRPSGPCQMAFELGPHKRRNTLCVNPSHLSRSRMPSMFTVECGNSQRQQDTIVLTGTNSTPENTIIRKGWRADSAPRM